MDKKLVRGIFVVFFANFINLFFSLATNFLLPKYLTIDSYAQIKTFQLYVSYVGLLHLGYVDGMYLKYGGKDLKSHADKNLYTNISTLRIFQFSLTFVLIIISLILNEHVLLFFSLSVLPINMTGYFKFLYQATGEFSLYGKIMNLTTILTFVVNMTLLFILKTDYYVFYVTGYVIIYFCVWILLEIKFKNKYKMEKGKLFSFKELLKNIGDGIFLTTGNLASNFLTSMDRWFVKILMNTLEFALYSFAVSIESFLNLAIIPVTTTLYNYFCKEDDINKHRRMLEYVVIFATLLPSAAFPAKFVLEIFLEKYLDSSNVIFILFAAQMFYIVIKSVFVNLYKVQRKQRLYFIKLIIVLVIGFVLNYILYSFIGIMESFAIGTLLSAIIWFIITIVDFKSMKISFLTYIYMVVQLLAFMFCGFLFNSIIGFIVYIIFSIVSITIFMHSVFSSMIQIAKKKIRHNKQENR